MLPSVIIAIAPLLSSVLNHCHRPTERNTTPTVNRNAAIKLVRHGHLLRRSLNGLSNRFCFVSRRTLYFDDEPFFFIWADTFIVLSTTGVLTLVFAAATSAVRTSSFCAGCDSWLFTFASALASASLGGERDVAVAACCGVPAPAVRLCADRARLRTRHCLSTELSRFCLEKEVYFRFHVSTDYSQNHGKLFRLCEVSTHAARLLSSSSASASSEDSSGTSTYTTQCTCTHLSFFAYSVPS